MSDLISSITSFSLAGSLVFRVTYQIFISTDDTGSSFVDVTTLFPPMEIVTLRAEDPISFQADTLEIIAADIGDRLLNNKSIVKGNWLKLTIHIWNRDYTGSHVAKDFGSFQIDRIKQQGPITQISIYGTSVPINSQIKLTVKNAQFFTSDLETLATKVATENGLKPVFDIPDNRNVTLGSIQQWNESDLTYLSRLCVEHGLAMKIRDRKLIIFDEQTYEFHAPIYTIDCSKPGWGINLEHFDLDSQSQDIYSVATVSYDPTGSGEKVVGTATAPTDSGSKESYNIYSNPYPPPTSEAEEGVEQ